MQPVVSSPAPCCTALQSAGLQLGSVRWASTGKAAGSTKVMGQLIFKNVLDAVSPHAHARTNRARIAHAHETRMGR
jgi:hypothetical protein